MSIKCKWNLELPLSLKVSLNKGASHRISHKLTMGFTSATEIMGNAFFSIVEEERTETKLAIPTILNLESTRAKHTGDS